MEYNPESAEDGEGIGSPVKTLRVYSPSQRASGSTFGSRKQNGTVMKGMTDNLLPATTPAFRPRLHINIPITISQPFTISGPAKSHHTRRSTLQLTSSSQEKSPRHPISFPVSHTQSRTWINPRLAEHERWQNVERNLKRMELIPRSPFVPHTFEQWVEFRRSRVEDKKQAQARRLKLFQESMQYPLSGIAHVPIGRAMGGRKFADGLSTVLALPSRWSPWYTPSEERPNAEWPSAEEMKEEGDERNTSRFGRFLGLPRVSTNATVTWKQRPCLQPTHFDEVWALPNAGTYEAQQKKTEVRVMKEMESMLGYELMQALDCEISDTF